MPAILDSRMHRNSGARLLFGVWAFASLFFATRASAYGQQTSTSSAVTITPSSASMLVTESASFSIVDSSGSPIRETEWTIRHPIADLTVEHGEVTVRALREGRAMLTGSTEYGAATATISIIPGSRFSAGTVR
jgi:hypothetical protein